jgi:hypothetical protein
MPTIAVDFDGVIHAYSRGWADGTIYDPPLPDALTGLRALMEHAAVFVHTTRAPHEVARWLRERGLDAIADSPVSAREFWDERGLLLVSSRKYPALAYLDDRAVRFHSWRNAVDETLLAAGLHPGLRPGKYIGSSAALMARESIEDLARQRLTEQTSTTTTTKEK